MANIPLIFTSVQQYNTTINQYSVPLTEEQANLYMKTKKYEDYLLRKSYHTLYYINLKNNIVPYKKPGTKILMSSEEEATREMEKFKREEAQRDKIILMTEGINGLPPEGFLRKQDTPISKQCFFWTCICCCFPCVINDCIYQRKHPNVTTSISDIKYQI